MAAGETRSLQDIRDETEETRARLTGTVDALRTTVTDTATEIRDRLRPESIKAEVSGYIRSRGETLVHDLTETARRNPMQAIAVGASIAYPLMRVVRAIPLPVLMIGAGLFFAGSKTGRELTQKASDMAGDAADAARRGAQDLGDQVSQTASDAREKASGAVDRVRDAVMGGAEQLRGAGAQAVDTVRGAMASDAPDARQMSSPGTESMANRLDDLKNQSYGAAQSVAGRVGTMAADASEAVGKAATDATRRSQEFLDTTRQKVAGASQKATRTMRETVEQHPLLVAGVGLFLGGLIASALPKLRIEDEFMGQTSSGLKRRAGQAAAEGFESAKGAADEMLASVAERAETEGLTPDGLARGMQDVGQRLQRVAERGITTAFEPEHHEQEQMSQTRREGEEHG